MSRSTREKTIEFIAGPFDGHLLRLDAPLPRVIAVGTGVRRALYVTGGVKADDRTLYVFDCFSPHRPSLSSLRKKHERLWFACSSDHDYHTGRLICTFETHD